MISSYHSIFLLIGWLVLLIGLLVSFVVCWLVLLVDWLFGVFHIHSYTEHLNEYYLVVRHKYFLIMVCKLIRK
jgi:hypothetical protein